MQRQTKSLGRFPKPLYAKKKKAEQTLSQPIAEKTLNGNNNPVPSIPIPHKRKTQKKGKCDRHPRQGRQTTRGQDDTDVQARYRRAGLVAVEVMVHDFGEVGVVGGGQPAKRTGPGGGGWSASLRGGQRSFVISLVWVGDIPPPLAVLVRIAVVVGVGDGLVGMLLA